jgi:hypothetical protein
MDYIYYKDKEQYAHTECGDFKVGKAVYATFVDSSLDINDPSWDVDYKDKNPNNCAVTNLIFVKNLS